MQPKHDAEPPSFALTEAFQQAYRQLVEQPIAADGRTQCLAKPFGRTMEANLEVLAYGRSAFRETISPYGDDVAPDEQVLLYCHYYMQRHYVAAKALYTMIVPQLTALCDACDRRLRFIDMGCGPAPAAIAFAEVFGDRTVDLRMVGIDASSAMLAMAEAFMRCACADKIGWKVSQTFDPSDRSYWCSDDGLPALVVFNCSHLFASITAAEAESLAHQIAVTAKQYPLNRYAVVVQQSNDDMGLNAYRVFCNIVSQIAGQRKQGQNAIAAETTGSDGDIYAYDVWVV
jgi:SAM-dependent methyltransferase